MKRFYRRHGFTLAELLIALAIMGAIATFTIPKVLQGQQDGKHKSMAKEAMGVISDAYGVYRLTHTSSATTGPKDLTPYINYVSLSTTAIDADYNDVATFDCGTGIRACLVLHNGGVLGYNPSHEFGGTATTNAVTFIFDPDAKHDANATGPVKAFRFFLYHNGRMTSRQNTLTGTKDAVNTWNPVPNGDPPWFSWN